MSRARRRSRPPYIEGSSVLDNTLDVDLPIASCSHAVEEAPSTIEGDVCLTCFVCR
jgi:hypothetical protein